MIIAVVTALSVMQAAGGLDYLLELAEGVLRRNPRRVTVLAPLVTYVLIFVSGTQHVIYALLPIIAEVSRKAGVRPERPLSVSVIAAQQGLTASPVSAVTVALVGALAGSTVALPTILAVTIPATLVGVAAGIASCRGAASSSTEDPGVREATSPRGRSPPSRRRHGLRVRARRNAIGSCLVFLVAIAAVVLLGVSPELRPTFERVVDGVAKVGQVEMSRAIMIVMLAAAGAILLLCDASAEAGGQGRGDEGWPRRLRLDPRRLVDGLVVLRARTRPTIVGGISALVDARTRGSLRSASSCSRSCS